MVCKKAKILLAPNRFRLRMRAMSSRCQGHPYQAPMPTKTKTNHQSGDSESNESFTDVENLILIKNPNLHLLWTLAILASHQGIQKDNDDDSSQYGWAEDKNNKVTVTPKTLRSLQFKLKEVPLTTNQIVTKLEPTETRKHQILLEATTSWMKTTIQFPRIANMVILRTHISWFIAYHWQRKL